MPSKRTAPERDGRDREREERRDKRTRAHPPDPGARDLHPSNVAGEGAAERRGDFDPDTDNESHCRQTALSLSARLRSEIRGGHEDSLLQAVESFLTMDLLFFSSPSHAGSPR
eukprot:850232-Rhodomonas_salina.1